MKLIKHKEFGYFVGWHFGLLTWTADIDHAKEAYSAHLRKYSATNVEKDFKILNSEKRYKGKLIIEES